MSKNIMVISDRLRAIRDQKDLSKGDIEQRTGLKRCYVSRVENLHTVPSMETREKLARALEVPMSAGDAEWGSSGESAKSTPLVPWKAHPPWLHGVNGNP